MIKHLVFFRLRADLPEPERLARGRELVTRLQALREQVPTVAALEAGLDFNRSGAAWDVALYSEFRTRADLDAYQIHPDHQRVKEYVLAVTSERAVVDYEV